MSAVDHGYKAVTLEGSSVTEVSQFITYIAIVKPALNHIKCIQQHRYQVSLLERKIKGLKKRLPQEVQWNKLQLVRARFERITRDQIEKFAIKLWDEYRSHVPEGLSNPSYFQLFEDDFDVWKVIFLKEGCRYSMVNPRCIANYHKRMNTLFNHMQREIA
jgi:hypothetical protein